MKQLMSGLLRHKFLAMTVLFLLFLIIHYILTKDLITPSMYLDEGGYIGNAKFFLFNNPLPTIKIMPFFYPGYSFLLMPALLIGESFLEHYQAMQFINGILLALIPVVTYFIIPIFSKDIKTLDKILISLIIGLYPFSIWLSTYMMPEILIIPLYLILVFVVYKLCQKPQKTALWTLPALLLSYLWLVHPRFIIVVPVMILSMLILGVKSKNYKGFGIFTVGLIIGILIKQHILGIMSSAVLTSSIGTISDGANFYGLGSRIDDLLAHPEYYLKSLKEFFLILVGHITYISLATFGLVVIGFWKILKKMFEKSTLCHSELVSESVKHSQIPDQVRNDSPEVNLFPFYFFLTLSALAVMVLSAINHAFVPFDYAYLKSNTMYLYGRYSEAFFYPFFIMGLITFLQSDFSRKQYFKFLIPFLAIISVLTVVLDPIIDRVHWAGVDGVSMIYYFAFKNTFTPEKFLLIFAIIFTILSIPIMFKWKKITLYIILAMFIFTTHYFYNHYLKHFSVGLAKQQILLKPISKQLEGMKNPIISYDKSTLSFHHYMNYFTHLSGFRYHFFDYKKGDEPISTLVISGNDMTKKYTGAKLLGVEGDPSQKLWLLPIK